MSGIKIITYMFWSVLPERIKGEGFSDLVGNGYLLQIFNYTRKAVTRECNNSPKES